MRLLDALTEHPDIPIFAVLDSGSGDKSQWDVKAIDASVLAVSDEYDFFIVKAKNVLADAAVTDCYMDMSLPERISDYCYFLRGDRVDFRRHYECDGEVICAVPIDCYGVYELFYSRTAPDVGIEILKQGLLNSKRKTYIAEDLAYILRDERRFAEAAEMFQIVADTNPTDGFTYGELARCYEEIGQTEKARKYRAMFGDGN